tara:strand:+ start:19148 stop:20869 length:1722 start_codon:yes stop_codon:yes gene_type:complete
MANDGSIKIGMEIDSSDAVSGLNKISDAMADTSDEIKDLGKDAQVGLGKVDTAADQAAAGLDHLASEAQQAGATTSTALNKATAASGDTVVGLDGLKDKSGEASSSMSALAGAVSIVSPEMGAALSGASALAGGFEGAAKATALFGGSIRAMMLTIAPIAALLLATAAAMALMRAEAVKADRAMGVIGDRVSTFQGLTDRVRSARLEMALLTGNTSDYEEQLRQITAQRQTDAAEIQAARVRLGGLNEQQRINALSEIELMVAQSAEAETLNTNLARNAEDERLIAVEAARLALEAADLASAEADAAAERARQSAQQSEDRLAQLEREASALAEVITFKEADAALSDKAAGAETAARLQEEAEALDEVAAATRRAAEADAKLAAAAELAADRQAELDSIMNASISAMGGFFDLAGAMAGDNAEDQKALAIAQTTINGLVAGIKAFADLGPIAGGIASLGIAASTAAAIAQISSQSIPTMHSGGLVGGIGDTPINAQGGEAVLNREAVAGLGAEGVEALNSGGGVGGTVVVEMTYKQRVFDRVVIDNLRKGGPLSSALSNAERRGRRGRVGGML